MTEPSTTRRGLLATTGAALVAGCTGSDTIDEQQTISAVRLSRIVAEEPELVVASDRPVDIERSELTASAQRVQSLLATLPLPFGPESVPNGQIRQRLTDAARDATDRVAEARTAPTRLKAFDSLRRARSRARFAAAGWAFVDDDLTATALETELDTTVSAAESIRSDYRYLGSDPVAAALVHGLIEQSLDDIIDHTDPGRGETSQLLTVAEWGEQAEAAQSHLDAVEHLSARFEASLPADVGSVEASLSAAVETLTAELDERKAALPSEPTADENRLRGQLQDRLWDDAAESVDRIPHAPGPASGVIAATDGVAALLAYDRFTDLVNDGEAFDINGVAAVRSTRNTAVDAITTALEESPRSDLARPILAETARSVQFADHALGRISRDVRPARLHDPLTRYRAATLRARSVPTACQRTIDALEE